MSVRTKREELLQIVVEEARKSAAFRRRVIRALADLEGDPTRTGTRRGGRRPPGLIDPFQCFQESGEEALRSRLEGLELEQLKDVVAEHGMDQARLALKWKTPDRLIDLIVSTVRERLNKGRAFGPG